jgi:glycopeptide antibiotics resistance protein
MLLSVWRTLLSLWLAAVLLVISYPWSKFDATPHWKNVQWIPFTHLSFHPAVLVEAALNLLAFIPIGYLTVRSLSPGSRSPFFIASLLGFCSSVSVEMYQLFCHDRVPSITDVLMNTTGTGVGVWLALAIDQTLAFCTVRIRRLSA